MKGRDICEIVSIHIFERIYGVKLFKRNLKSNSCHVMSISRLKTF